MMNRDPQSFSGRLLNLVKLGQLRSHLNLTQQGFAEQLALEGKGVQNVRILFPAQRVPIASPSEDDFVPRGKYYREGWCDRPNVFVCDVPEAKVHIPSGLVCTRNLTALADVGMAHRMGVFAPFGHKKPTRVKKIPGTYSTINYCLSGNIWHWMLDCLPKIHSLAKVAPKTSLTLLMPSNATEFQRQTLQCILPDHFKVTYGIKEEWVQTEHFLWASLISDRCLGLLPDEYYRAIRHPIFQKLGLPLTHNKTERIYISRRYARHRRVNNEDQLIDHLKKYGFRTIDPENLSFEKQVEIFHRAEIIVSAHGAGLGGMFFSGEIAVVVLYSTQVPPNYFHTLAIGLGQKHLFLCHDEKDEDSDFEVNLPALENLLKNKLNLRPVAI